MAEKHQTIERVRLEQISTPADHDRVTSLAAQPAKTLSRRYRHPTYNSTVAAAQASMSTGGNSRKHVENASFNARHS